MRPRVTQILKLSLRLTQQSPSLQSEYVKQMLKNFPVSKSEFLILSVALLACIWTVYVYCICDVRYSKTSQRY